MQKPDGESNFSENGKFLKFCPTFDFLRPVPKRRRMFAQFAYSEVNSTTMSGEGVNMTTTRVIDTTQADEVYSKYNRLDMAKREEVLTHPSLTKFSDKLRDIWLYTNQFIGQPGFVYHAVIVAKMCGYAYETRQDKNNFLERYLRICGTEGVDWDFVPRNSIFPNVHSADDIELLVPGTGETVVLRPGGNATKFPMLTERFARTLLAKSNKPIGREYVEFLLSVHDVMLAVASSARKRPADRPAWRDEIEYKRALLENERIQIEIRRQKAEEEDEAARRRINMYSTVLDFARNNGFADDERGEIQLRDITRNFVFRLAQEPGQPAMIADAEPVPEEVTISDVVLSYLGRPLRGQHLGQIGKITARMYKEANNGEGPPKRTQYVDGAPRQVNSYTTRDLPLIHAAIDAFVANQNQRN